MSCGMLHTDNYAFSSSWVSRSESVESLTHLDAAMGRLDAAPLSDSIMTLEDLRSEMNSCHTCGVSWNESQVSLDCRECGGYTLSRPCPMCDGKCSTMWRRDISMSHSLGKAHWEGECALSSSDTDNSVPAFLAEDILVQGMEELTTS
ncbi:protein pinocchio isoform X2 [Oratosquilla oratoria]